MKPADLWPMFLAAAEARGETEEFATSEWDRRVALRNDEIWAHSNLFASDYMVQPDDSGNQTCFLDCAVCTWVGEHLAHQCKTTEPGYVPNSMELVVDSPGNEYSESYELQSLKREQAGEPPPMARVCCIAVFGSTDRYLG